MSSKNMNNNAIQIRKATSSDIFQVSTLIRMSFLDVAERFGLNSNNCTEHPSNCTDRWIEKDLEQGVTYYILECNGTPSGCVAFKSASNAACYLERLAVLPDKRYRGYGKLLVNHVIAEAKTLNIDLINIGIIEAHTELKRWYMKMGFNVTGTKKFDHLPFLVTLLTYDL